MLRTLTIALGLAVVVLATVLALRSATPRTERVEADDAGVGDAASAPDGEALLRALSGEDAAVTAPEPAAETFHASALQLADGTKVPPLGPDAPKRVRFGVVLVAYRGAEGAGSNARGRQEALALAGRIAAEARSDFAAAVREGDEGSAGDVGVVDRNTLEPAPEAVLFALPVGGTSDVVDTPRGFWIVKRLE